MPRFSEHEQSGAIGMLKGGVRVSDVARFHNCQLNSASEIATRLLGQLNIELF